MEENRPFQGGTAFPKRNDKSLIGQLATGVVARSEPLLSMRNVLLTYWT